MRLSQSPSQKEKRTPSILGSGRKKYKSGKLERVPSTRRDSHHLPDLSVQSVIVDTQSEDNACPVG